MPKHMRISHSGQVNSMYTTSGAFLECMVTYTSVYIVLNSLSEDTYIAYTCTMIININTGANQSDHRLWWYYTSSVEIVSRGEGQSLSTVG